MRGAVVLPNGTGKNVRVVAIAKGDAAKAAEEAGAMMVGDADLVAKIQNEGFIDFDVLVTTPDMMGLVGRLGKILGPRGLMPNPKAGTVTPDVGLSLIHISSWLGAGPKRSMLTLSDPSTFTVVTQPS